MRSIASDGNFTDDVSEFGVPGREFIAVCCTGKKSIKYSKFYAIEFSGLPSFLLGESGLFMGTINRLKLDTRSRNDNAGLGGATGR